MVLSSPVEEIQTHRRIQTSVGVVGDKLFRGGGAGCGKAPGGLASPSVNM